MPDMRSPLKAAGPDQRKARAVPTTALGHVATREDRCINQFINMSQSVPPSRQQAVFWPHRVRGKGEGLETRKKRLAWSKEVARPGTEIVFAKEIHALAANHG